MKILIIAAVDENNGIGKNNQLPWHLPADLKHFKLLTLGHSVIMGRKTFDSIGEPLPQRRNIVITRQADLQLKGAEVVNSLNDAFDLCKSEQEVFVAGGAEIFRQALQHTQLIYLTRIHQSFDADTFFPDIDPATWVEKEKHAHQPDEKNRFPYTFITYGKR